MPLPLKPGTRLLSAACATEMIVVRAPAGDAELTIGGHPPVVAAAERTQSGVLDGHGGGSAMGKRYVDDAETIELLCTKPGEGVAALGGVLLVLKEAKALPASD